MRLVWSEQALADVEDTRGFVARDAPAFAELFVDRILEAVEHLVDFPEAGRAVPEFERKDLREVFRGSYRIVYHVQHGTVSIVPVFHMARLLGPEHVRGME